MTKDHSPVTVTKTAEGLTNREIAIAVIADKLGIAEENVNDKTELGDKYREIVMVVTFKTGGMIISNQGMLASDLFLQL